MEKEDIQELAWEALSKEELTPETIKKYLNPGQCLEFDAFVDRIAEECGLVDGKISIEVSDGEIVQISVTKITNGMITDVQYLDLK